MASNKVNLGIGAVTGMFYTAPAGTALPSYPGETLAADWVECGAVSDAGLTWATGKDSDPLRDWSKTVRRLMSGDEGGTVTAPLLYTEEETLKTIFGADNVTITAADATHGKITSVTVAPGVSAPSMAFLFIMKDGDDLLYLGTEEGIVRDVSDVSLSPTEAIVWECTIEAASWTFAKNDGQHA